MRRAHVPFQSENGRLTVSQVDEIELDEVVVPGDPSSAAFIVAAAMLVPGSRVVVSGMGLNWTRTAFFRIVAAHGRGGRGRARGARHRGGHRADRRARRGVGAARGHRGGADEVPLAIDELTLVALLGAFADGETVVRGAAELRLKESDRIAAVVEGLRGLGADIEETADGFVVRGDGSPLAGGTHRRSRRPPAGDARRGGGAGLHRRGGGGGDGIGGRVLSGLRGRSRSAHRPERRRSRQH